MTSSPDLRALSVDELRALVHALAQLQVSRRLTPDGLALAKSAIDELVRRILAGVL